MNRAGAASANPATEFCSGQADDVAHGPKQRHLRIGVDIVLDAIDFDLCQGESPVKIRLQSDGSPHFFSAWR
jgi:hypothetical protein